MYMYIMYECTLYLQVLKLVNCIVNYKYTCICTCTYSPVCLWNLLDSSIIFSIYKYFKFSSYMYMYMYICTCTYTYMYMYCFTISSLVHKIYHYLKQAKGPVSDINTISMIKFRVLFHNANSQSRCNNVFHFYYKAF